MRQVWLSSAQRSNSLSESIPADRFLLVMIYWAEIQVRYRPCPMISRITPRAVFMSMFLSPAARLPPTRASAMVARTSATLSNMRKIHTLPMHGMVS